jgi:hypothetical protein
MFVCSSVLDKINFIYQLLKLWKNEVWGKCGEVWGKCGEVWGKCGEVWGKCGEAVF